MGLSEESHGRLLNDCLMLLVDKGRPQIEIGSKRGLRKLTASLLFCASLLWSVRPIQQ